MIRSRFETLPILMLTALGNTDSKLNGFDAGADGQLGDHVSFLRKARLMKLLKNVPDNSIIELIEPRLLISTVTLLLPFGIF